MRLQQTGIWLALVVVISSALPVDLGRLPLPHSLSTISRFYIYGKPNQEAEEWLPSFGWGLWDVPYPLHSRVITDGVSVKVSETELAKYAAADQALTNPGVIWLAVMESTDFWSEFMPFQSGSYFCCRQADVEAGLCAREREVRLPQSLKPSVMLAPIALSSTKPMRTDAVFPLSKTGAYYLLLVNCMDSSAAAAEDSPIDRQISGKVFIESSHGFLSGIDVPKLKLYFDLSIAGSILALWWMLAITKAIDDERDIIILKHVREFDRKSQNQSGGLRRNPLLPYRDRDNYCQSNVSFVHNYLSLTLLLQLTESILYYIYYSWENNSSAGASYYVEFPAIMSSVLKNVVGTTLVLALALGVYSIHERMPPYLKVRVFAFSVLLMITDAIKTFTVRFHSTLHLTPLAMVLCAAPVAIVSIGGCFWIWKAINRTIQECAKDQSRLFHKQVMLQKLRRIIVVAAALYTASACAETSLYFINSVNLWKYEYMFTDSTPVIIFFLLTLCVAIITRPSIQKRYKEHQLAEKKLAAQGPKAPENLQIDSVQIVDPRSAENANTAHDTTGYRTFTET